MHKQEADGRSRRQVMYFKGPASRSCRLLLPSAPAARPHLAVRKFRRLLSLSYLVSDLRNLANVEWLGDYPIRLRRIARVPTDRLGPTTDDRERDRFRAFADGGNQVPPAHLSQANISEHEVEPAFVLIKKLQRFLTAFRSEHFAPLILQRFFQDLAHYCFVIHYQHTQTVAIA